MKEKIESQNAPQAIGPYSQAIKIQNFIFCSGQIPIDPSSGEVVNADIREQTKQVLENLKAVVETVGASMKDVVKTTVYLQTVHDFADMNKIYEEYFSEPYPARATVEVSSLPKGVKIEIEAIAVIHENTVKCCGCCN